MSIVAQDCQKTARSRSIYSLPLLQLLTKLVLIRRFFTFSVLQWTRSGQPISPAPALDFTAARKLLAAMAAFAYAAKADVITTCSRSLVTAGTLLENQGSMSSAAPDNLQEATGTRRRPAYDRDHLWLRWHEQDKMGPAKIRDGWDGMSDDERKTACPRAWETISGDGAKMKKSGREVVITGLKKARKERDQGL